LLITHRKSLLVLQFALFLILPIPTPNPDFSQATSSGTNSSPSSGDGESPSTPILFSASDLSGLDIESPHLKLPHFSPDELLGFTFIRDMDDGSKYRAKVACKIVDNDAANHQKIKFLVKMPDGNSRKALLTTS
jgi:hypothetical protein